MDVGSRGVDSVQQIIKDFFESNKDVFPKACVAFEVAEKTKKYHFQGVFISTLDRRRLSEKLSTFEGWGPNEKAFTLVKKPESYLKYIKKDGDIRYFHGFTEDDIESWGDWIEITKKEKDLTRREKFYQDFIQHCRNQNDWEMGRYKLHWVAEQLFDFLGKATLPEQVPWLKGVVFSTQCALVGRVDGKRSMVTRETWVDRLLS